MTADHLGSPRIVTDGLGAVVSRYDYMAFGDEVTETIGNVGGRTTAQGYGEEDEIRKGYTGYERDDESGLDFAQARYYNSQHGRFTSVDPLTASANVKNPQTFNRYSYVLNSPYKFVDPLGLFIAPAGSGSFNQPIHNPGYCGADSASCSGDSYDPWEGGALESEYDFRGGTLDAPQGDADADGSQQEAEEAEEPEPPNSNNSVMAQLTVIVAWGDPGIVENQGKNFERAAKTAGENLESYGNEVLYFHISSINGFQGLLDTAAKEDATHIFLFTHGGWDSIYLGDGKPNQYNTINLKNVRKLQNNAKSLLEIVLKACFVGANENGIAANLAKQLNVKVEAPTGGTIFSNNPKKPTGLLIHPDTGPTYLINDGGTNKVFRP